MLVSKRICTSLLCGVALAALPLLASARPKPDTSRTEKTSIQIDKPATVDGTTLARGQYEIVIEGNKATFEHNGQTVVTAPIDWKATTYKSPYDSVTYSSNRVLQEIQFAGSDEALEVM